MVGAKGQPRRFFICWRWNRSHVPGVIPVSPGGSAQAPARCAARGCGRGTWRTSRAGSASISRSQYLPASSSAACPVYARVRSSIAIDLNSTPLAGSSPSGERVPSASIRPPRPATTLTTGNPRVKVAISGVTAGFGGLKTSGVLEPAGRRASAARARPTDINKASRGGLLRLSLGLSRPPLAPLRRNSRRYRTVAGRHLLAQRCSTSTRSRLRGFLVATTPSIAITAKPLGEPCLDSSGGSAGICRYLRSECRHSSHPGDASGAIGGRE